MYADRPRLRARLRTYLPRGEAAALDTPPGVDTPGIDPPAVDPQALEALEQAIREASLRAAQRAAALPRPELPSALPITARCQDIAAALAHHQVAVVCGETGSGKSTQLPKLCLALGRGVLGMIGHTQPRRIAARSLAARVAHELGSAIGHAVGYKVRFGDKVGPNTYIKLMTDGILLAELEHDRRLFAYDTLIIDEAHERSLNIDLLLGCLKRLLPRRPELKLIVTSATIDPERFSRYFDGAPVIEVSGRGYPVEVRYRPLRGDDDEQDGDLSTAIGAAVDEISRIDRGDILVFLPGEREIREAAATLGRRHLPATEVLPLYARLGSAEQDRVFLPHPHRRIVLATNVAETSLTVPGIRYVIDTGLARINRYSPHSKVQRLVHERISRASADQRKGRCGRQSAGVCIRLYSEDDYSTRPEHTDPEVLRVSLAALILKLGSLHLGAPEDFPFLEPPDPRRVKAGYKLLEELGAVEAGGALTGLGWRLARLPTDPRIGRMVLAAESWNCLTEVLIIASGLSIQDPRERRHEAQAEVDEAHRQFVDGNSDFLWFLNLWRYHQERARELSQNQLRGLCRSHFISYVRMQEWREVHAQLSSQSQELGLSRNAEPASYEAIHRALLTGLLGNIGFKTDKNEYTGARGVKFHLFPGSALFKRPPAWVMAAEIAETTRRYARIAAVIEPEWVEAAAGHLLRRSHSDPHWEKKAGRACAHERVTLYGLTLAHGRKVDYTAIDPAGARRLFIRSALVEGDYDSAAPFVIHNRRLVAEAADLENRARRLDILVDESARCDFYDARIPPEIACAQGFEAWRKSAERDEPRRLHFKWADLIRPDLSLDLEADYPLALTLDGQRFPLSYRFEPGHEEDGVTVTLPLALLNALDPRPFEWLVPGLLREKVTALIQSLPKALRRHCIPVDQSVDACLLSIEPGSGSLLEALCRALDRKLDHNGGDHHRGGLAIRTEDFDTGALPEYLAMRFRVTTEGGAILGQGRSLCDLKRRFGKEAQLAFRRQAASGIEREGITRWDFGALPGTVARHHGGLSLQGFPALVDQTRSVAIRIFDSAAEAEDEGRRGLRRLFMLSLPEQLKYLRKGQPGFEATALLYLGIGSRDELLDDLTEAAFDRVFIGPDGDVRGPDEFEARLEAGRARVVAEFDALCARARDNLSRFQDLRKRLERFTGGAGADVREQLQYLIYRGFVSATPEEWLKHLPRYLKAISLRLERLARDPAKDRERSVRVAALWRPCRARLDAGERTGELLRFRFLLEEFRVSLFAQELGTAVPVSEARLARQWNLAARPDDRIEAARSRVSS
jgi:ATP-dependent RNA helicase HrpA